MKKIALASLFVVALALSLAMAGSTAGAQGSSDYELRCGGAQTVLETSVRSRDLHTRVDRLQTYRYLHKNLDSFTQRLENNAQPRANEFRDLTARLNGYITNFTNNYETYDQARDSVSDIRYCKDDFDTFQRQLYAARDERARVSSDIAEIRALLDIDLRNQLLSLNETLSASQEQTDE